MIPSSCRGARGGPPAHRAAPVPPSLMNTTGIAPLRAWLRAGADAPSLRTHIVGLRRIRPQYLSSLISFLFLEREGAGETRGREKAHLCHGRRECGSCSR